MFGQYQFLHELGEGGMGKVYLARSPGLRLVALKVIRPAYAAEPEFRERFRREIEAARAVRGMFTPPVLDADPDGNPPWLATTYVPAPSLSEVVRYSGVLGPAALRALGAGLAEALTAIHRVGLVHRDLKPGNVLIAMDGPRVIDFGIVKAFGAAAPESPEGASALTVTGHVIGTPGYMAPEQLSSDMEVGPATDVFALGCVLKYAASGTNPFGRGTPEEMLGRVLRGDLQLDGVPDELRPLVEACLAKDTASRPSVDELLLALSPADPVDLLTPALRQELATRGENATAMMRQESRAIPTPSDWLDPAERPRQQPFAPGRRGFLAAAAAAGVVLGGATAGVVRLSSRQGSPVWLGGIAPGSLKQTPNVPGRSTTSVATASTAPAPIWRRNVSVLVDPATLTLQSDTTLVRWIQNEADTYSTKDGSSRAKKSGDLSNWLGTADGLLLGIGFSSGARHFQALDATGALKIDVSIDDALTSASAPQMASYACLGMSGGIAVIAVVGMMSGESALSTSTLVAFDTGNGKALWHRAATWGFYAVSAGTFTHGPPVGGLVAGKYCLIQDGTATRAIDLRTGSVAWTVQNTGSSQVPQTMAIDGATLITLSTVLTAVDTTTGSPLWTKEAGSDHALNILQADHGRVFRVTADYSVTALDSRTGKPLWYTPDPLPASISADPLGTLVVISATDKYVAVPLGGTTTSGVLVLSATDGKPLWVYHDAIATGTTWSVLLSGATLYADTGSTLFAFPVAA
ncbi:serine/threonine protein kinase/outer membrane protein assembly factor BamB [Catenulispora sp. GAS73]|uniref:protein kinase domain-containing protein n=1 Tax=Catenulispora sp. GAS73 TaxID=3156269 RepID=UPI00351628ED